MQNYIFAHRLPADMLVNERLMSNKVHVPQSMGGTFDVFEAEEIVNTIRLI